MWYPPQQHHHQNQQQRWHGYNHHLSSQQQQQQQSYSRTSYYCTTDEPLTTNQATNTYVVSRNDENESFNRYHSTQADDLYVAGTDYYVTTSTGSYSDEMSLSSLPYQTPNTHWNPIISAPTKTSIVTNSINQNPPLSSSTSTSTSSSSSACWDWLLYSPEIYSHLYRPSSSFIQHQIEDEDFDLSANLPTWLLALLYPSMKQIYSTDDENDSDQEISSLHNNSDEPLLSMNIDKNITHVSSNLSLSSENTLNEQKLTQNRSSTPDTDDGYQSASDASRSDYSQQSLLHYDHHSSKDDVATVNISSTSMPKRISYAAAVKPLITTITNNKASQLITPITKTKNNSSSSTTNDLLNTNGQKLKFIAPRFERMHHAKQYPSRIVTTTTTTTTTTGIKDSSSSSSSICFINRTAVRSYNNYHHNHQRNHIVNSTRRR
ncbi:hypothetical protein I4U23_002268 [Adineta vaga]|nr:hypothetical protein I4U23_002268 [Adineta vaga]